MDLRIIPWDELQRVVPYSRQHVSRLEKAGKFPKRVKLGEGRIGWFKFQIDAWLIERARLSGIVLPIRIRRPDRKTTLQNHGRRYR